VSDAISDSALQWTLGRFAALAGVVLDDPAVWLGEDDGGTDPRALPVKLARRTRRLVTGRRHPGSPGWEALPVEDRVDWWLARIRNVAAPVAATPRVFGAMADRLPVQGAFGAAFSGLTVCAVAREHGVREPAAWVPLLARVLFDRDLAQPAAVAAPPPAATVPGPGRGPGLVRRGGAALWRLARVLWEAQVLFDERPRGAWIWRAVGKIPVVGLAGGFLDERGAVTRTARETTELLARSAA
jgi:hypothetical protein